MLLPLTQIVIYLLFFQLMYRLIAQLKIMELTVAFIGVFMVTLGEAYNLFKFKMAVYNGVDGIPLYIILGGAMVSWGIYHLAGKIYEKYKFRYPFYRILIIFGISLFLPIIEILGLKAGFWYWRRPYSILSFAWFHGVWSFYLCYVAMSALLGEILKELLDLFKPDKTCSSQQTTN